MDEKTRFRAYMKAAGGEAESECVSEAVLVEYYQGSGDSPKRERVQSHLVTCESCRQAFDEVREFLDPPRPHETALPARAAEDDWRLLERRIRADRPRPRLAWLVWAPIAASMVLAVAVGWISIRLREAGERNRELETLLASQIAEQRAPRANASIHDIFSREFLQRSPDSRPNIVRAAPDAPVTLILHGAGQREYPSHRLEIVGAGGQSVWTGAGIKRVQGNYTIAIPGGFLKDGEYTFRIWGGAEVGPPLAEYVVSWRN